MQQKCTIPRVCPTTSLCTLHFGHTSFTAGSPVNYYYVFASPASASPLPPPGPLSSMRVRFDSAAEGLFRDWVDSANRLVSAHLRRATLNDAAIAKLLSTLP